MNIKYVFYVGFIILIIYIILFILELINDSKIKKIYNNMIYNWNSNPIKSIELIEDKNEYYELAKIKTNKNNYSFYSWKNKYFRVEKLTDYDYNNIYINEKGKLCGKDSNGNNLYFPENINCPINEIYFSISDLNDPYLKQLKIDDNYYLYFTNTNIEGKILVDIRAGSSKGLQLNLEKDNDICESFLSLNKNIFKNNKEKCSSFTNFTKDISLSHYKKIDTWQYKDFINKNELEGNDDIVLYSINYLGINSTLIDKRESLKDYKKNMEIYNKLFIYKCIMYSISILFFIIPKFYIYHIFELYYLIIPLIIIIIIIIHFIILNINFQIHKKYIQNILSKINEDAKDNIVVNVFNIFNLIFTCFLLLYNIFILSYFGCIYYFCKKNKDNLELVLNNKNNNSINNKKINKKIENKVNFNTIESERTNIEEKDKNDNSNNNNNNEKNPIDKKAKNKKQIIK